MAKRKRPARPQPSVAHPPKVPMLLAAGLFALLAVLAVVSALVAGQLVLLLNAVVPALVSALFFAIALRQSIELDRKGVQIHGFGSAGRTVRWTDVDRLELTDASKWRLGPRLIVKGGRALPVPAGWRLEDGTRLPEAVRDWSRWARVSIVGDRVTGRRWPLLALLVLGALMGFLVLTFDGGLGGA